MFSLVLESKSCFSQTMGWGTPSIAGRGTQKQSRRPTRPIRFFPLPSTLCSLGGLSLTLTCTDTVLGRWVVCSGGGGGGTGTWHMHHLSSSCLLLLLLSPFSLSLSFSPGSCRQDSFHHFGYYVFLSTPFPLFSSQLQRSGLTFGKGESS